MIPKYSLAVAIYCGVSKVLQRTYSALLKDHISNTEFRYNLKIVIIKKTSKPFFIYKKYKRISRIVF